MFWKKREEVKKEKLPKGIEKVDGGYRVIGLQSIHRELERAEKQLRGWKDVN